MKINNSPDISKLAILMQQWKEGQLTNWEYLMALNQISGRTYQDLMQYPVFPWILSNYEGASLNLNDLSSFRILEKPIAVQSKESEMHFINNFEVYEKISLYMFNVHHLRICKHLLFYNIVFKTSIMWNGNISNGTVSLWITLF